MFRIVTLLILLSFVAYDVSAQFTSITQSTTNTFQFAEISESDGVALIGGIKALKSTDNGFTWNEMNIGMFAMPTTLYNFTDAIIISPQVYCLVGRDNTNYKSIIIRTTDGGNTWTNVLESANGSHNYFKDICYNGTVAIATAKNGVYRSTDNGVSWNFVAVSGMTGISDVVQYNDISNVWVIEKFSSYKYKSTDNGANWTATPYFGYTGNIYHIGNIDDKFLATWSTNTSSALFRFDENLLTIDTIVLDAVKTFSTRLEKSFYLPNSDILTYSNAFFIKVDTATANTYYYNHNLIDPVTGGLVQTNDFDFDQTYGLAVGQYGGLSRFDAVQPEELYVPADFTLTSNTCPGDTIFADALFDYADSVKWFFDGNLVSTDTNLIYETPYQFGTFDLVHHTWYNGLVKSDTQQVYFAPLNPATPYSFGYVDTIPCYQTGALAGVVSPGNTNWNGALEVWLDSVMLDSISPQPTSNFSFTTPVIDSQDTLYLVSKNKQTCGTSVDSTQIILYPGDDLYDDYQLLPGDSAICLFDTTQLNLLSTNSDYTYNWTITNDFTPSVTSFSLTGTGTDTMNVIGPVGVTENNYDYDNTNYFFELVISDDTENCQTSTIHLDTIVCIDPRSLFHTHSKSYYRNDTVEITNVRIKQNRFWEVSPNGLNVLNVNDTVPIIYGDTTGVYELALTNEPVVGCSSRSNEFVTYADSLESLDRTFCNEESGESRHKVMKVKLDNQGNIFELGVIKTSSYSRPAFHLTKRDSEGQFMWEQKAWFSNFGLKGAVIEDIDFDENGDVYAALWVDGDAGFSHELISYYPTSGTNTRRGYVVKFDGQTGDMIWAKDLENYPLYLTNNPSVYAYWRIMSIVVTESEIHFSVGTTQSIFIVSTTLSGDYISQSNMNGFRSPDNMLVYTGSTGGPSQSNHSPRLMEMNNGDIVGVAYYTDGSVYSSSNLIPGMNIPQGKHGIMAFKYNSQNGLYDFKKLAEMSKLDAFSESLNGIPMFDLDKNDNLSVGFNWREDIDSLSILDSVIVAPEGTCVFQVDENFDLRWITVGNYSYLNSVEVAEQTGETFVSGITRDNISFSNGDTHKMLGGYGQYSTEYGSAFNFWEMETYQYKPQDLYLVRMDSTGSPDGGYLFDDQNTVNFCSRRVSNKIDVTPCGDIVCVINQNADCSSSLGAMSFMEESGLTVSVDSSKTFILRSDCSAPVCSVLNLGLDTLTYCSSTDSLLVSLGSTSFNVDSVTYDLIENGNIISTQTVLANNNGFYLSVPNSTSDFSLEIVSPGPVYDSVTITYINQVTPTYSFDSLMCWGESQVISGLPSTFNYLWLGDSSLSSAALIDTSNYTPGVNNLDVISTDEYGCKTYDTLNIYVYEPIEPNLDSLYFLSCESDTILPIQSVNYTNEEWFVNGSPSNNLFSETNLNAGLNIIEVTLTDTNSCVEQYNTLIDLQEPVYPNLNTSYILSCDSDTILPLESSSYTDEEWLLNGSTATNLFSSSNLNIGVNNISVTLTDTNGCIEQYNTVIDYCYDLGINEPIFLTVDVVPNPNTGKFEVRFRNFNMNGKLSLVSSIGQIVYEKEQIFKGSFTIEVNTEPGVYWLLIDTNSSRIRRKVIIND